MHFEMIKRVAKVLQDFKVEPPQGPVPWDKVAIAAIKAIREPTNAMLLEASSEYSDMDKWKAMIDAALK